MQYMLMFYESAAEYGKRNDPAAAPAYWGAWQAYMGSIVAAGALVNGDGLQLPETGTTVRVQRGVRHVQDGPVADTKEHLGGYAVIRAASLDEALDWAARSPCAQSGLGATEVRPVLPPPGR
jgi:hypothetical protein